MPLRFPFISFPLIAPLWDDVSITRFGNIFYRVTSNVTLLQRARDQLQELFPSSGNFTPTILFIATWDRVTQQSGVGAQVHMPIVCLLLTGRSSIMCPCYYSSAVESHLSKGPKYDVNYIPRYKLKNWHITLQDVNWKNSHIIYYTPKCALRIHKNMRIKNSHSNIPMLWIKGLM